MKKESNKKVVLNPSTLRFPPHSLYSHQENTKKLTSFRRQFFWSLALTTEELDKYLPFWEESRWEARESRVTTERGIVSRG